MQLSLKDPSDGLCSNLASTVDSNLHPVFFQISVECATVSLDRDTT